MAIQSAADHCVGCKNPTFPSPRDSKRNVTGPFGRGGPVVLEVDVIHLALCRFVLGGGHGMVAGAYCSILRQKMMFDAG